MSKALTISSDAATTIELDPVRFAERIAGYEAVDPLVGTSPTCTALFERLRAARRGEEGAWAAVLHAPVHDRRVSVNTLDAAALCAAEPEAPVQVPPGDKHPQQDGGIARMNLCGRERTRLVVTAPEAAAESVWLHVVMQIGLVGEDDPRAGIRAFLGSSDEVPIVRFRNGGMVFLREIRADLPTGERPFLLSIGLVAGEAVVYCDGLPRHRRTFELPAVTGFVFDVHSQSDVACRAALHGIAVQRGGDVPFWMSQADEVMLAETTALRALGRPRAERWRMLQALAAFPKTLPAPELKAALLENRTSEPYLPELDDLLNAAAPVGADVSPPAPEPQPLVRIRDAVVTLASNPGDHSFWPFGERTGREQRRVVDGVSLDAFKGDIIGILGRNGAGKSTLLKTIVGAMPLSSGRIEITGKPVLLRPGAGMQPNLSGRQNIVRCGLYMNLEPREIAERVPEIAEFAELQDHLDRPIKYYSDGMRSRLIFAIATAMPYDILLLDELLSAGDIGFQKRVTERLDKVIERAKLLFVVQHTFDFVVSRCSKCLVMSNGQPIFFGDPQIAAELYREEVY